MKEARAARGESAKKCRVARRVAAAVLAAAAGPAAAFQPLVTDDTGTQGKGDNQLEAGYARATDKLGGDRDVASEAAMVYTRGVTDELDLYLGFVNVRLAPAGAAKERGWSNPAFGAKWRFYDDEASKLSFALKPELRFPVNSAAEARGLGTARSSFGFGLLATQETAFGAVHANVDVKRINYEDAVLNGAERRTQYRVSVAPVWDVSEQLKLALDAGVVTNPDLATKRHVGYLEIGAIYSHSKDLDLALGVIQGMSDGPVKSVQWTAGLTWRFQ